MIVIPLSIKINNARAISWIDVFILEILEAGTLTFIPAKYSLKPDTAISLSKIIKDCHLTPFEQIIAVAFDYFSENNVEV